MDQSAPPAYEPQYGGEKQGYPPSQQQPQAGYYPPPQQQYPPPGGYGQPGVYPGGQYPGGQTTTVVAGAPQQQVIVVQDEVSTISDYMIANIVACLCCCWCIGIAAILKSNECQNAKARQDVAAARSASDSAKKLLIATIVCGVIFIAISVVVRVVLASSADSSRDDYYG